MTEQETLQFVNNTELIIDGETWKQHPTYTNYYASNLGRVKYVNRYGKEMIKIQNHDKRNDRFHFCIHSTNKQKRFKTARFICESFNGIHNELNVDHINTVQYDNRIENLRFCTPLENVNNPKTKSKGKTRNGLFRIEQLDLNGSVVCVWDNSKQMRSTLNLNDKQMKAISRCCNGQQKTAHGFQWKRYEEPDIEGEIWEKHPSFEKLFVSNKGRIKRELKLIPNYFYVSYGHDMNGFMCITVNGKHLRIHRIVAETFIPNPQNYPYVYHIDGNRHNNKVENLKWGLERSLI